MKIPINHEYKWVAIIIILSLVSACDLNRIPESDLSDAVYWQSESDFQQAVNYLYRGTHNEWYEDDYQLYADRMSDNVIGVSPSSISNGTFLPQADFGPWDENYEVIRAANKILEKAASSGLDSQAFSRYLGEAKFFRAYAYTELVKRYGDVPLILKSLNLEDEDLYKSRTPREIVMDTVYQDLDYAAANLPAVSELDANTAYGSRISSGTALVLKSRAALYEGTRLKFHGTGNMDHSFDYHLQIARDAALEVMQSGEFELFDEYGTDSYRQLFKAEGEGPGNPEIMWAYIYGFGEENEVNFVNNAQQIQNGELGATRSLIQDYLCTDGMPIEQSPLYQGEQNAGSIFENRDPRLDGTIVKPGDIYFLEEVEYIPQLKSLTGYHVEKFFDTDNLNYLDLILIRYAEVLLNYAEATFELDESISDEELNTSINLLRDRVGMLHLTNAFVSDNGLSMREEIRRERRVELALEGFRYDDLIRWKTAEVELPKPILGVRFFNAEYPADDPSSLNLTQDSVVIAEPADKRSFDSSKQYLWPIPLNQISLNPNLEQNPNWN